jgi:hypothetical protein
VVLQLDEEVVAPEDLLQPPGLLERATLVTLEQRLQDVATEAAGRGDEALVVLLEQLPVQTRLVVVALQKRPAGELDEVAVAGFVLGEQREVVVELAPALGVAARVVDAAAPGRAFAAMVVSHVGLGAEDRLDALLAALLVELECPVHVAVIGQPERRLPVGDRFGHEFVQAGGTVEHGELGVHVQVGERVAHGGPFCCGSDEVEAVTGANHAAVIRPTLPDRRPPTGAHPAAPPSRNSSRSAVPLPPATVVSRTRPTFGA